MCHHPGTPAVCMFTQSYSHCHEALEFFIYVESECLLSASSVGDALADLMHLPFQAIVSSTFIRHFIIGLRDAQKVPTSVAALSSCLESV